VREPCEPAGRATLTEDRLSRQVGEQRPPELDLTPELQHLPYFFCMSTQEMAGAEEFTLGGLGPQKIIGAVKNIESAQKLN